MFKDKVLLITGGTGSFGNAVLKRFLSTELAEIRIFSRDEKKQEDMRIAFNDSKLKFYIGDVRDPESVASAMRGVNYVFHAAALKQVPSCEFYPMEALRTNVIGTENVLNAASGAGAERVVVLSTDKAVYPINAMGLTKAMGEKLVIAKAKAPGKTKPVMSTARYGNVMASRGSVIPLFVKQIKAGKPLTVTDPDMTRFMMSLADSVDLVLYTYEHARPGDIFVQKAPACTIGVLVQALCRIFGAEPELRVIGARHGEKSFEHLVAREEAARAEDLGGYFRIAADERDLNYARNGANGANHDNGRGEGFTSLSTRQLDLEAMVERLLSLDYIQAELTSKGMVSEGV